MLYIKMAKSSSSAAKKSMKCGEVRKSTRPDKKVMKLYCINGKKMLVHAGARGYGNNYSDSARKSFKARHKCSTAQPGTARHLACTELWKGPSGKKTAPTKSHPGKK